MIYCVPPEIYPTSNQSIEEVIYRDENDFEWKISRVQNGFFIRYFGDPHFQDDYFSCDLDSGEHILINNTNCIFIQDSSFETFEEVRNIIKIGYTDDIWEAFEEMFEERFEHDKGILESEIVRNK